MNKEDFLIAFEIQLTGPCEYLYYHNGIDLIMSFSKKDIDAKFQELQTATLTLTSGCPIIKL